MLYSVIYVKHVTSRSNSIGEIPILPLFSEWGCPREALACPVLRKRLHQSSFTLASRELCLALFPKWDHPREGGFPCTGKQASFPFPEWGCPKEACYLACPWPFLEWGHIELPSQENIWSVWPIWLTMIMTQDPLPYENVQPVYMTHLTALTKRSARWPIQPQLPSPKRMSCLSDFKKISHKMTSRRFHIKKCNVVHLQYDLKMLYHVLDVKHVWQVSLT